MGLDKFFGWNKEKTAMATSGSACGSGDKPSACGSGDKPSACGSGDKPSACGSACGSKDK